MNEDEPALQGNENEKEKENNEEEEYVGIQKASSPNKAASPKKPVALTKLNTRIKREGDVTNEKFDELPSDKAYVVVPRNTLYAGPDTEDRNTPGFNRGVMRSKVKGTLQKKQDALPFTFFFLAPRVARSRTSGRAVEGTFFSLLTISIPKGSSS